ncbi:2265_t:CDS:2 [Paraglomus occultum]|uniref:2265_t:CDS:1 n=1 Tax=Paraglomus occultum TaxID=144539 RepID=A0A9N9AJA3_9GLOM|nr:2265_t:CDS:2 [Paraglomus occultum]
MPKVELLSLAYFIIDEIRLVDGTVKKNVIGGGGTHATYGMRIWYPSPESQKIGFVIQAGNDFPSSIFQALLPPNLNLTLAVHSTRPSTRGLNVFASNGNYEFSYVTPSIRTEPRDLPSSYLECNIIHLLCSPTQAKLQISEVLRLRDKQLPRPVFVWEPSPRSSKRINWDSLLEAMRLVDVILPNHKEAAALLGLVDEDNKGSNACEEFLTKDMLNRIVDEFLSHPIGIHGDGCVILRAAHVGCVVATKQERRHIPAYYDNPSQLIVDVTGAGNSFCGGVAAGLLKTNFDVFEAALYGTVSASYTIEQVGVPTLKGLNDAGQELWSDEDGVPEVRLAKLRQRISE